jgi:hypothetical protein
MGDSSRTKTPNEPVRMKGKNKPTKTSYQQSGDDHKCREEGNRNEKRKSKARERNI